MVSRSFICALLVIFAFVVVITIATVLPLTIKKTRKNGHDTQSKNNTITQNPPRIYLPVDDNGGMQRLPGNKLILEICFLWLLVYELVF